MVSYKVAGTDWKLTISDNGIGKPDVKREPKQAGLGTSLIQALARQLDATLMSQAIPRHCRVHDARDIQSHPTSGDDDESFVPAEAISEPVQL